MKITSLAATLVLLGSASAPAFAQPAPPPVVQPSPHRNPAMRIAGIVLTSIASASLLAGIVTLPVFSGSSGGDVGNIGVVLVSLPLMGGSLIFAGVGIPLWIVGASAPPAHHAALIPSLSVGAGSTTLRWTF